MTPNAAASVPIETVTAFVGLDVCAYPKKPIKQQHGSMLLESDDEFHAAFQRLPTHVCVFAGSSDGASPEYMQAASTLGKLFAERNIALIYGGGSAGIMGKIAWEVQEHGGKVTGIIPDALVHVSGEAIGQQVVVKNMHERKRLMNRKCEAFVALAGGFGTMEELMEMITWSQLNIHGKPIIVLNTNDFYAPLRAWIEQAKEEQFISTTNASIPVFVATPDEVISALEHYQTPKRAYELIWHHHEQANLG